MLLLPVPTDLQWQRPSPLVHGSGQVVGAQAAEALPSKCTEDLPQRARHEDHEHPERSLHSAAGTLLASGKLT